MASQLGLSLHVTIQISPSNVSAFFDHFKPAYDKVIDEPECLFFEVFQAPEAPGTISWVENWDATQEWFMNVQLTKDYYKPYLEATEPMFLKPRQYRIYDRVGPPYVYVDVAKNMALGSEEAAEEEAAEKE